MKEENLSRPRIQEAKKSRIRGTAIVVSDRRLFPDIAIRRMIQNGRRFTTFHEGQRHSTRVNSAPSGDRLLEFSTSWLLEFKSFLKAELY
jgi:hypothetical protein